VLTELPTGISILPQRELSIKLSALVDSISGRSVTDFRQPKVLSSSSSCYSVSDIEYTTVASVNMFTDVVVLIRNLYLVHPSLESGLRVLARFDR
jgi:hypothetical protein